MRRMHLLSCAVLFLGFLGAAPAHASGGTVTATSSQFLTPEGDQFLIAAECHSFARPSDVAPTDVPLATTIRCSVNGHEAAMITPGAVSVVHLVTAASPPLSVCFSGSATFLESPGTGTPQTYTAEYPETCQAIGP